MLNNSLTEFAFHQAALTGYVIPSGQRPRALNTGRNLESMSHLIQ